MRFLRLPLLALFVSCFTLPALPQAMTSITATSVNVGGVAVNGTICLQAVDRQKNPITVSVSGGSVYLATWPFCQQLVAGALSGTLSVPNSSLDSAPGHPYDLVIFPGASSPGPYGEGFTAPSGTSTSEVGVDLGLVYGIAGSTWSLDDYVPNINLPSAAFTFTTGTGSAPSSCFTPAIDVRVNSGVATESVCFNGAFVAVNGTGTGGGGAPGLTWRGAWSSSTAYVATDAVSYGGSSYIAIAANTNTDLLNTAYWNVLAAQGATGSGGGGGGGTGINWRAAWSSSVAYAIADAVSYSGSSYIAVASSTNQNPSSTTGYWNLMAQQGATGATGAAGSAGGTGSAGATGATGPAGPTTAAAMQTATAGLTGCTTAGYSWNPATNTCTAGGGVQISGDIGGTNAAPVVTGIWGKAVAATAPTDGQVQIWNASSNEYVPGPVVAAPAVAVEFYPAAVSDGGTAFAAAWTRYDNNEPQTGSINPAASAQGYMAFQAAPVLPQYTELTVSEPGYWTGTGISIDFFSAATTGNVTWEVQAVCIAAGTALTSSYSPTFSTPVALTTAVSSTATGLVTTATLSNLISPGTGSCPSSPTTPTKVTYRIYRAASDTAAGNANLLGATLLTGRSQ